MKLFGARYRPWIVYAAFSLMSLGIMTSNLQGGIVATHIESTALQILAPFYTAVDRVINVSRSVWNGYIFLIDIQAENRKLREIIFALREEHLLLVDKAQSAQRLETLIGASHRFPQANIKATVIRRGNLMLNPTVLIDRGSVDGLREGLGVATADGALGLVVHVTNNVSKVLTLHHSDTAIGAMMQQSRVQGVVSGTGKGTCVMRFISRFDRVTLGEKVITSGLDGAFPKGVPIGRVATVRREASEIFQTLEIVTNVNINALEEVIVFLMPEFFGPEDLFKSNVSEHDHDTTSTESDDMETLN
jgi:rod shape-determining protein MreC